MRKLYTVDGEGPWTLAQIFISNADAPISSEDLTAIRKLAPGEFHVLHGATGVDSLVCRVGEVHPC